MSAIQRSCTSCGAWLQVDPVKKGQQAACPYCGGLLTVPPRPSDPSATLPDDRPAGTPPAMPLPSAAERLLPPTADASPEDQAGGTTPATSAEDWLSSPADAARETDELHFDDAALQQLQTPSIKRHRSGGKQVALRRLTREEKAIRRRRNNLVAFLLTAAALGLALAYLLNR